MYPDASSLAAAYASALRRREEVPRGKGKCNAFSCGGERPWLHGPDKPGGRVFCYFDGNDAVIVWTHAEQVDTCTRELESRFGDARILPLAVSPTGVHRA